MNDFYYNNINYSDEQFLAEKKLKEKRELRTFGISTGLLALISIVIFSLLGQGLSEMLRIILADSQFLKDESLSLIPPLLINAVCSLLGFGIVGTIFSKVTKYKLSENLPFSPVQPKTLFSLTVIGYAVCLCANYIANIFNTSLSFFGFENTYSGATGSTSLIEHAVYILAVAVVPAITEEFIFRGIILQRLRKFGDGFAVIISAAMFGLMHGNFVQIPFAFVIGLVIGWTLVYTNSMLPGIIIHFVNNFISVMLDILNENSSALGLNTTVINLIHYGFLIVIIILAIVGIKNISNYNQRPFKIAPYKGILNFKERVTVFCTSFTVIIFTALMIIEGLLGLGVINNG